MRVNLFNKFLCLALIALFSVVGPGFSVNPEKVGFILTVDKIIQEDDDFNSFQNKTRRHLVWFHPGKNQLYYQKFHKYRGKWKHDKNVLYDLGNEKEFKKARKEMYWADLFEKKQFDQFKEVLIGDCQPGYNVVVSDKLNDFQKISDQLFEQHLAGALPKRPLGLQNNTVLLEINLLGVKHHVQAKLDPSGNITELYFNDEKKMEKHGLTLKKASDDQGRNYYSISAINPATGKREVFFGIEGTEKVGKNPVQLAVYVKGRPSEGSTLYNDYEKSLYELNFDKKGVLKTVGTRKRLNGDPEGDLISTIKDGGSGGFTNFVFQIFFSKTKKKKYIRDEIYNQAIDSLGKGEFAGIISEPEIRRSTEQIVEKVGKRTDNFSDGTNKIKAVAMEESLSHFSELLLKNLVGSMLPGEDQADIKKIVDNSTQKFRTELAVASKARNPKASEKAMATFEKEAPIKIGREILKQQLKKNGVGEFSSLGEQEYNNCIQEKYIPLYKGLKKDENPKEDPTSVVKACLFEAVLKVVDRAIEPTIEKEIALMVKESKEQGTPLQISLTSAEKSKSSQIGKTCMEEKKFYQSRLFGNKYNFHKLKTDDPNKFLQEFDVCLGLVKENVGRTVAGKILKDSINGIEGIDPQTKLEIEKNTLDESFEKCVSIQKKVIKEQTSAYWSEVKGIKSNQASQIKIPSFDPSVCSRFVINKTVKEIAKELIASKIGKENFDNILKEDGLKEPSYMSCFDKEQLRLEYNLKNDMISNASLIQSKQKEREKEINQKASEKTANCLKEAILWSVEKGSGFIIDKMLSEKPELANVPFGAKEKKYVGEFLSSCFKREVAEIKDPQVLGNSVDKIQDTCGAQMLKDPQVQAMFFVPVINSSLKAAGLDKKKQDLMVKNLMVDINLKIKDENTIDGLLEKVNQFKGDAVVKVVHFVIEDKIDQSVEDPNKISRNKKIDRISKKVKDRLFNQLLFDKRLKEAATDEVLLEKELNQLKYEAALAVAPEVIQLQGEDLLESGLFKDQKEIEDLKKFALGKLKPCLKSSKEQGTLDKGMDKCIKMTTNDTVYHVVEDQINFNISSDGLGNSLSDQQRNLIRSELLGKNLKDEISKVGDIVDPDIKKREFKAFTLGLKTRAVKSIGTRIIPAILDEQMKVPSSLKGADRNSFISTRDQIGKGTISQLEKCLASVDSEIDQLKKTDDILNDKMDLKIDGCLNRVRLGTTIQVLPIKLEEALRFISSDENKYRPLQARAEKYFKGCVDKIEIYQKSDSFTDRLDSCLVSTILEFSTLAIDHARALGQNFLKLDSETIPKWKSCLENIKDNAIKESKGKLKVGASVKKDNIAFFDAALSQAGKIGKRFDLDWVSNELKDCSITNLAPSILSEYKNKIINDSKIDLTLTQKRVLGQLTDSFSRVVQMKMPDGSGVKVDVLIMKDEKVKTPENKDGQDKKVKDTGLIATIERINPMIMSYFKAAVNYDPDAASKGVKYLEEELKKRIKKNGGSINLKEINEILVASPLVDTAIKALISDNIRETLPELLKEYNADLSVIWKLSDKKMIDRIFDPKNAMAKKLMSDIKNKWLIKLLNGELKGKDAAIPENIINQAKVTLLSDTKLGGFSETLFGAIVQKQLDEKREGVESGLKAIVMIPAAVFIKRVQRKDFFWGHEGDGNSDNLRYQPSGKEAVMYFADNIAKPMMLKGLSDKEMARRQEKLSGFVEQAMHENSWP